MVDYNELALGIDTIIHKMDKRNLTSLLEIAQTAGTVEKPEFYLAYFAFLIARHLPDDQTDQVQLQFFRRAIEALALEVDSELNLVEKRCPLCGKSFLTPVDGRSTHYCSQNGLEKTGPD